MPIKDLLAMHRKQMQSIPAHEQCAKKTWCQHQCSESTSATHTHTSSLWLINRPPWLHPRHDEHGSGGPLRPYMQCIW